MRDYAKVSPAFWTGETGRKLRGMGPEVQLVALYLLTSPSANMIGLYYLPIPVLCHETGLTREGASKALRRAFEGGFASYDEASETVWVPEMARFQIGEKLSPRDNRHKAVLKELETQRKSPFYLEFHKKYKHRYSLPAPSPFEAPSKPLRSQEQEQEQEQDIRPPHPPAGGAASGYEHIDLDLWPDFVAAWTAAKLPGWDKNIQRTSYRVGMLQQRLAADDWRERWREAVARAGRSSKCRGCDPTWSSGLRLDTFLKDPDMLVRVLEGEFDDSGSGQHGRSGSGVRSGARIECEEGRYGNKPKFGAGGSPPPQPEAVPVADAEQAPGNRPG